MAHEDEKIDPEVLKSMLLGDREDARHAYDEARGYLADALTKMTQCARVNGAARQAEIVCHECKRDVAICIQRMMVVTASANLAIGIKVVADQYGIIIRDVEFAASDLVLN